MNATCADGKGRTGRAAASALALAVVFGSEAATAQAAPRLPIPSVAAGDLILAQSGSTLKVRNITAMPGAEVPLGISVALTDQSQSGLVMIRGIPGQLSLTTGFRSGETWMVSVKDLPTLRLAVPENYGGSFDIEVILVLGKENRERKAATVAVAAAGKPPASAADSQPTSAKIADERERAAAAPPVTASAPTEEEKAMIERAVELLRNGDVASARLLYQHLANSGSALAALSLARTYDPEVLPSLGVIGMRANPVEAERWYKRAAELGNESAARRLRSSSANR